MAEATEVKTTRLTRPELLQRALRWLFEEEHIYKTVWKQKGRATNMFAIQCDEDASVAKLHMVAYSNTIIKPWLNEMRHNGLEKATMFAFRLGTNEILFCIDVAQFLNATELDSKTEVEWAALCRTKLEEWREQFQKTHRIVFPKEAVRTLDEYCVKSLHEKWALFTQKIGPATLAVFGDADAKITGAVAEITPSKLAEYTLKVEEREVVAKKSKTRKKFLHVSCDTPLSETMYRAVVEPALREYCSNYECASIKGKALFVP